MILSIIIIIEAILIIYLLFKKSINFLNRQTVIEANKKAKFIINQAKKDGDNIKKEKILQAKEKFLELKSKHEDTINLRERKIVELESKIRDKEDKIKDREDKLKLDIIEIQKNKEAIKLDKINIQSKLDKLNSKKAELDIMKNKQIMKEVDLLEKISNYSADEAKRELINLLKDEARSKAESYIQTIIQDAEIEAKNQAKKIIISSIQRLGVETSIDNAVSVFNIESDDIKGRIIGREGRNIRAIEAATGVEIIVDDTPDAIILSCFDPVRREIARLSLHHLVNDGRIHPARIEEVVAKTSKYIEDEILEAGKKTILDLGIHGLHKDLVKMVGRMKYRSSYGQNLLHHSKEVSHLSGILASELGLNAKLAKRAGLLHDIGKVPEQESQYPHAILGMKWAEKYGEHTDVINAIGAHHDEIDMTSLISPIVQVADAISGARPGARRQAIDSYIQRLKDLEKTAISFDGVDKAYAIQAGRELRVIVESEKVDDNKARKLSFLISEKIQKEITYPGQVKVTVIRETRAVNIAR